MHDLLLALALLASKPGAEMRPEWNNTHVRAAVRTWAVAADLTSGFADFVYDEKKFADELDRLRKERLARRLYPPLDDLRRLPDLETCKQFRSFAYDYTQELQQREQFYIDRAHYEDVLRAATDCHRFWAWATDAHLDNYYSRAQRRYMLNELKTWVGDARWYAGDWPPPVPVDALPFWSPR